MTREGGIHNIVIMTKEDGIHNIVIMTKEDSRWILETSPHELFKLS